MEENISFPVWKPNWITLNTIHDSLDSKKSFKAFRSASSGFISKPKVRAIILEKSNYKCCYCSTTDNLQIDHILSVVDCFMKNMIEYCNTFDNLQILCRKCNLSKPHTNG